MNKEQKKRKGFSFAELMLVILILSIAMSAMIPIVTKRSHEKPKEDIWHWSAKNDSAFFGVAANQTAIVGAISIPEGLSKENIFSESISGFAPVLNEYTAISPDSDKFAIFKKVVTLPDGKKSAFKDAYISFYELPDGIDAATSDIKYVGRIAMDKENVSMGKRALQNAVYGEASGNTAIGHYSLFKNTTGSRNTAFGFKTLMNNKGGSDNTAIGFEALKKLTDLKNGDETTFSDRNTAAGSKALANLTSGSDNTAAGSGALKNLETGSKNTALGTNSCSSIKNGTGNICIGAGSGKSADEKSQYGLFIGSGESDDYVDLITGHTDYKIGEEGDSGYDKELIFNTRFFGIKPNGSSGEIYSFEAKRGNGYDKDSTLYTANSMLALNASSGSDPIRIKAYGDSYNIYINTVKDSDPPSTPFAGSIGFPNASGTDFFNIKFDSENVDLRAKNKLIIESEGDTEFYNKQHYDPGICSDFNNDRHCLSSFEAEKAAYKFTSDGINLGVGNGFDDIDTIMAGQNVIVNVNDGNGTFDFESRAINFSSADMTLTLGEASTGNQVVLNGKEGSMTMTSDGGSILFNVGGSGDIVVNKDYYISNAYEGGGKAAIEKLQERLDRLETSVPSDIRLKNITGDSHAGLSEINRLEVKNFTFKNDKENKPQAGVIAQDLKKIFPNSVFKGKDGYLRIKTEEIFWAMINAIKELALAIKSLGIEISSLDKSLTKLEKSNKKFMKQNSSMAKENEEIERRLKVIESKINR